MKKKPSKIKSAIINWLGIPIDLKNHDFWGEYGSKKAGQNINESSIMSLSAAWACTRIIAETIATLPIKIYEKTESGRVQASNYDLSDIVSKSPNSQTTASCYWESVVASVLLRGKGVSERQMIGNRLVGLKFLPANRLKKEKNNSGKEKLFYKEDNGKWRELDDKKLFLVNGFSLDGINGMSTISYGASVFGSALAATDAANNTFENGLSVTTALKIDRTLTPDQREEYRDSFEKIAGAVNAGKTTVLEGGMDAKTIGIPPKDAQLLESRQYSVEEVCRWFRVDPSLVGHGGKDSNWGTGLEQKLIGFLTFTLRPWLTRIEQAINKQLIPPQDQDRFYAEFCIEGLLRADSQQRANFYSQMVNNGIFTRDEVRQKENLPIKGGNADVLTVQVAMAPLDKIGESNEHNEI